MADSASPPNPYATAWCQIPPPDGRGIGPVGCPRCRLEVPEAQRDAHVCGEAIAALCGEQVRDLEELAAENAALRARCAELEKAVFELTTVQKTSAAKAA